MNKKKGKLWLLESRLENTRESVAAVRFSAIEEVIGDRSDAERRAQEYLDGRFGGAGTILEWIDGTSGSRPARYAFNPNITFRITQG